MAPPTDFFDVSGLFPEARSAGIDVDSLARTIDIEGINAPANKRERVLRETGELVNNALSALRREQAAEREAVRQAEIQSQGNFLSAITDVAGKAFNTTVQTTGAGLGTVESTTAGALDFAAGQGLSESALAEQSLTALGENIESPERRQRTLLIFVTGAVVLGATLILARRR